MAATSWSKDLTTVQTNDQGLTTKDQVMPLYEYQCDACGHRFEKIQKFSDPLADTCPKCGGAVHKLMSSPAIQFKGSGFYITDYPKGEKGSAPKSDGGKSDQAGKADLSDASGKSEKSEKGDKTEKSGTSEKGEKFDKSAKADAPAKTDKGTSSTDASSSSSSGSSKPPTSTSAKDS
jgi:putative FmdB family regulatory protein